MAYPGLAMDLGCLVLRCRALGACGGGAVSELGLGFLARRGEVDCLGDVPGEEMLGSGAFRFRDLGGAGEGGAAVDGWFAVDEDSSASLAAERVTLGDMRI